MPEEEKHIVPNRAQALTIVASNPINENWEAIQESLNENYDLAVQVETKIDEDEKGVEGGVATLDINNKLTKEQIPDEAKGHVYTVNSLAEQLALDAYSGDICVRNDINTTYALSVDNPADFANWVEIATSNAGGDIGANPCYTSTFTDTSWISTDTPNSYYLTLENTEHGQGETSFLFVSVKNTAGREIALDYLVEEDGTVTIYSDITFSGKIMISNLLGNVKNAKYVPYSILSGAENNGIPSLLSYSLHNINLICSPIILLVDGFDYVRNITSATSLTLPEDIADGIYVLFADSANFEGTTLTQITYLLKDNYLGVLTNLPNTGTEGQRCYIAYDRSYEFMTNNWVPKAFTPIGEFITRNGLVESVATYPFRQNGIDINYQSTTFDYLYGSQITGLNITIEDSLVVSPGTCANSSKIITLAQSITKNYTQEWAEGANQGCLDSLTNTTAFTVYTVTDGETQYYTDTSGNANDYVDEGSEIFSDQNLDEFYKEAEVNEFMYTGQTQEITQPTEGWGYIYIIKSQTNVDILLSFTDSPILPLGYTDYRQIGYFYRDSSIKQVRQVNDIFYFTAPTLITDTVGVEKQITISVPDINEIILNYKLQSSQSIKFYLDNILVHSAYNQEDTIKLPINGSMFTFTGTTSESVEFNILGYVDKRNY